MGRVGLQGVTGVPAQSGRGRPAPVEWSPRCEQVAGDEQDELAWRRHEADLVRDQVRGIEEWTRVYGERAAARMTATASREARLDLSRRAEARRLEHQALMARAGRQLAEGARLLRRSPQAVIAHRSAWFTTKVADRLVQRGVEVVAVVEDGASASGALVVEQPELLLVEDRLPVLSGYEVLERARAFAPATFPAVQLMDSEGLLRFQDAGARALFTRRVPPAEVADALADCVFGRQQRALVL